MKYFIPVLTLTLITGMGNVYSAIWSNADCCSNTRHCMTLQQNKLAEKSGGGSSDSATVQNCTHTLDKQYPHYSESFLTAQQQAQINQMNAQTAQITSDTALHQQQIQANISEQKKNFGDFQDTLSGAMSKDDAINREESRTIKADSNAMLNLLGVSGSLPNAGGGPNN